MQPRAIEALTQGKTIIMIAHRLKTVKSIDQSIVINQGKISQQGTHDDLIRQSGIYADFVGMREKAIPLVLGIRGGIPFMLFLPNALDYLFYAWFEISKNGIDRTSHGMIFCMKLEITNQEIDTECRRAVFFTTKVSTNQLERRGMNGSCGYGKFIGGAADIPLFADNGRVKNRESV